MIATQKKFKPMPPLFQNQYHKGKPIKQTVLKWSKTQPQQQLD